MRTLEKKPNPSHETSFSNVALVARPRLSQEAQSGLFDSRSKGAAHEFSQVPVFDKAHHSGLPSSLLGGMEQLSGEDLSQVRIHTNSPKPARFNALAYTHGRDIHLGPGQGKHLPHEAWHAVQQIQGRVTPTTQLRGVATNSDVDLEREADVMGARAMQLKGSSRVKQSTRVRSPVLQRRRVPGTIDTIDLVWEENADAHGEGLIRLVNRAWPNLNKAQQTTVLKRARNGDSAAQFKKKFPEKRDRYVFYSQALKNEFPGFLHGDPDLYQIGARDGTADAVNITTLVDGAHKIFTEISSGTHDKSIGEVFGKSKVLRAKRRYARADRQMRRLKRRNKIVTDRSHYSEEVGLGGLTNAAQIMVSADTIDKPADKESVVTMIHESMHAGNNSVSDELGYIHRANFTRLPEAGKLKTASYFEVVPRRILKTPDFTFTGQTFVPAGTKSSSGKVTPTLTTTEKAIQDASNLFRDAWTSGLNLHDLFVSSYNNPKDWNKDVSRQYSGVSRHTSFADSLPFWSKVEGLTVHRKTDIDPTGEDKSKHPVSIIDIALSEGVVRKLNKGQNKAPDTPAEAKALESHASSSEKAAIVGDTDAETELISKLVLEREVGEITGDVARDKRVVKRMAKANGVSDFSDMIVKRPPSDFP